MQLSRAAPGVRWRSLAAKLMPINSPSSAMSAPDTSSGLVGKPFSAALPAFASIGRSPL
jgi:hypothetical protein